MAGVYKACINMYRRSTKNKKSAAPIWCTTTAI